jgi:uncharacterized protein (TIGR04255 family)
MKLLNAPIIEMVLDIDCDMPPNFDLISLEKTATAFLSPKYPKARKQLVEQHIFQHQEDQPTGHSTNRSIQAVQFLQETGNQITQIIQFRTQGFSFNRLKPYSSFDDYIPEIEAMWQYFVTSASPLQIRAIRLRYINRIEIPLTPQGIELNAYFNRMPEAPHEDLIVSGFLFQYSAIDKNSEDQVSVVLTTQPLENNMAPFIFDNTAFWAGNHPPQDWAWILSKIMALRELKNRVFDNTLTKQCVSLFQQ